jgi:hypothetical protein
MIVRIWEVEGVAGRSDLPGTTGRRPFSERVVAATIEEAIRIAVKGRLDMPDVRLASLIAETTR